MQHTVGPRFRRVLCPIDFSKHSAAALRYAAAVADRAAGQLTVLFVNDPLLVAAARAAQDERGMAATTALELRRFVEQAIGPERTHRTTCVVALGDPAREILKSARRLKSDLVVVGTRGLGGTGKLFFGSTTARVLHSTPIAVLSVPPTALARYPPDSSWPKRIMAAIELGGQAMGNARRAAGVARWFKGRLMLVTVVPTPRAPSWLTSGTADGRAQVAAARERLQAIADKIGHEALTVRVLTGSPAEQIATAAADAGVGMIVLSLKPADRLFDARQGSITYRVLCTAEMPILALSASRS